MVFIGSTQRDVKVGSSIKLMITISVLIRMYTIIGSVKNLLFIWRFYVRKNIMTLLPTISNS